MINNIATIIVMIGLIWLVLKFVKGFFKTILSVGITVFGLWWLYTNGLIENVLSVMRPLMDKFF